MKIRYLLCRHDYASHTGYGICAVMVCRGKMIPVRLFHDLSSDKVSVLRLIQRCNTGLLSLCHLRDVIDDYLAGL